jgi:hypothetical protein
VRGQRMLLGNRWCWIPVVLSRSRTAAASLAALAPAPVAATAIAAPVAAVTATVVAAAAPPCCEHCQRNHILFRVWLELDRATAFATRVLCLLL